MNLVADNHPVESPEKPRQRLNRRERPTYELRLYVTGMTASSTQSIAAIKAICEEHLSERYTLQVIDLYQQPERAGADQVSAVPTLIKELPPPLRRVVGNLADRERVLVGLDLCPSALERWENA